MEQLTVEDIRRIARLISVPLDEDRLTTVASLLNLTMESLQPLTKVHLPKELEPNSYLARIGEIRKETRSEDH